MRTQIVSGVLVILAALAAPANTAEVTPGPGTREFSAKTMMCELCHAVNGMPRRPTIPVIWGQGEAYLLKQLRDFQSKARDVEVMEWAAKSLSPEELAPVAAYFSKKTWPARSAAAAASTPPRGIAV